MKILIKIINRIRVIFKSFAKKEKKLISLITFLKHISKKNNYNINFDDKLLKKDKDYFIKKKLWPKKIAACIIFHYNPNRLKFISLICKNIELINKNTDITLVVNKEGFKKQKKIKNFILKKTKININFFHPKNLLDPRLLTYSHFEVFKKKIKSKKYTHFLYLEDDILINEKNIKYWMLAKKSLVKTKLIPVFLRTEINKKDKKKYLVDSTKKNFYFFQSKLINIYKNIAFTNLFNFFTPAYFYDKKMMQEHFNGPSSSIDFGHGTYDTNFINPNMISLGVMERAATLLAYKDVPEGFFHRNVVPVDVNTKLLKDYCLVEHLSNRFTNEQSDFGKIRVENIFIKYI